MKLLALFIIVIIYSSSFACTIRYDPPNKFDPEEYIFIGRVTGYTYAFNKIEIGSTIYHDKYCGLEVEPIETIYSPEDISKIVEVYPLALMADCRVGKQSEYYVKNYFPVGSEIRVVGKKTALLPNSEDRKNIRLEVSPFDMCRLSLNLPFLPSFIATLKSNYDYKSISENDLDVLIKHLRDSLNIDNYDPIIQIQSSIYSLKDFELRKDLFRLHSSSNDTVKAKTIHRIKNFESLSSHKLIEIINTYIENKWIRRRMLIYYLDINKDIEFHKIFHIKNEAKEQNNKPN